MGNLGMATPLQEVTPATVIISGPLGKEGRGLLSPSHPLMNFESPSVYLSCAGNHRYSELVGSQAMSCPEDTGPALCPASGSCRPPTWILGEEGGQVLRALSSPSSSAPDHLQVSVLIAQTRF